MDCWCASLLVDDVVKHPQWGIDNVTDIIGIVPTSVRDYFIAINERQLIMTGERDLVV